MASLVSTWSACAPSRVNAAASSDRGSRLQNGSSSSSSSIKMMAGVRLSGRSTVRRRGFAGVWAQAGDSETDISISTQSPINPGIRKEEPKPFGQVPVLEHGPDFTVFESRAIMRYILSSVGEKGNALLGTTLREQAKVDQWLQVEATSYDRTCGTILFEKLLNPNYFKKPTDFAKLEEAKSKLSAMLDVYEKVLTRQEYLAGDHFTVADLSHVPQTTAMFAIGLEDFYNSRPHVRAWWARVSQREACQKISSSFPAKSRSA